MGTSAMAETRCFTVFRALVAVDNAALGDILPRVVVFFVDVERFAAFFALFAALRFVVIVSDLLIQDTLGKRHIVVVESQTGDPVDEALVVETVPHTRLW